MEAQRRTEINLDKLEQVEQDYNDRRKYRRFDVRCDAELVPTSQQSSTIEPIQIQLRDIERSGIGFICPKILHSGEIMADTFFERTIFNLINL